jgi:hypothetical protein
MQRTIHAVLTVIVGVAALVAAGCGSSAQGRKPSAAATPPLWVGVVDCSPSFRRFAHAYLDDFGTFTAAAAEQHVVLSYGCVAGRALNASPWKVVDFSDRGPTAKLAHGSEKTRARLGAAQASGAEATMRKLLASRQYGGSDLLAALERASGNAHLQRIAMWSDLLVSDGIIDLRYALPADLRRTAKAWIPRMGHGLRGVTVLTIGSGQGASGDELTRRATHLVETIVHGAGGTFGPGDSQQAASDNAQ